MGLTHGSRRSRLLLPLVALVSSGTVLLGAGDAVRISSPAHKTRVSGTIAVTAEVTTSAPVAYVLLVVDGTRPAATNSLPATFRLDTRELSDGPHVVSAEAYADFRMIAASKAITVYVDNQTGSQVLAKQRSTPQATAAASAPNASRTVESAPRVSTGRITGPAGEPPRTWSLAPIGSRGSDTAGPGDAVPSPRVPMIVLNGRPLAASVAPTLVRGQMHAGLRALFTPSGARIDWLADRRVARCVTDSLVVEVPIGSRIAMVNGRHVDMGAVATIKKARTVVPLRFFAQVTGSRVCWDARTRVASVQTPSRAVASAQASLTSTASVQSPVSNRVSTPTPIYEVADLGP